MKLPGNNPNESGSSIYESTSINSAYKKAVLQPKPAMVNPAIKKFYPQENPNDYLQIAKSEMQVTNAIVGTIGKAFDVYDKIDAADDLMESRRASAELKSGLSAYTTEAELRAFEDNPETGKKYWETAKEDYQVEFDRQSSAVRDKYTFQRKTSMHDFQLKSMGYDSVHAATANSTHYKGKMLTMEKDFYELFDNADNMGDATQLVEDNVAAGVINTATGYNKLRKKGAELQTRNDSAMIQSDQMDLDGLQEMRNAYLPGGSRTKDVSDDAARRMVRVVDTQVYEVFQGRMFSMVKGSGVPGGNKFIQAMEDKTPEELKVGDEAQKQSLLGKLTTSLNRRVALDKHAASLGENINFSTVLTKPNPGSADRVAHTVALKKRKNKDVANDIATHAIETVAKDNPQLKLNILALDKVNPGTRNSIEGGFIPETLAAYQVNGLRSEDNNVVMQSIESMTQTDRINPNTWTQYPEQVRKQHYFIADGTRVGMDSDTLVKAWRNKPHASEMKARETLATSELREDPKLMQKAYDQLEDKYEEKMPQIFSVDFEPTAELQNDFNSAFVINRQNGLSIPAAAELSLRNLMQSKFLPTSFQGGEARLERSPPHQLMGLTHAAVDERDAEWLKEHNKDRIKNQRAKLDTDDIVRKFAGYNKQKQLVWVFENIATGDTITHSELGPDGKPQFIMQTYLGAGAAHDATVQNISDSAVTIQVTEMTRDFIGETNTHLLQARVQNRYKLTDIVGVGQTGFNDRRELIADRTERWGELSESEKDEDNARYNRNYNVILDLLEREHPGLTVENRMNWAHNTLMWMGYMHGDENNNYKAAPATPTIVEPREGEPEDMAPLESAMF